MTQRKPQASTVVSAQVQSSPNVMPAPLASEARERNQAGTQDTYEVEAWPGSRAFGASPQLGACTG
jgi:hypothetical protein